MKLVPIKSIIYLDYFGVNKQISSIFFRYTRDILPNYKNKRQSALASVDF